MSTETKAKSFFSTPLKFFKIFFVNLGCHNGKQSKIKMILFICALCYIIVQPWVIVRGALASFFTGYILSNTADNALTAVVQMEPKELPI